MSERYGPETRGIIDAINGLKKPTHEYTTYRVLQFDLAAARVNELVELEGWFDFFGVGKLTGSASLRINEPTKDLIDLAYVKTMKVPIRRFYLTNIAQAGAELTVGLGGDASFEAQPIRQGKTNFMYAKLDEDGAADFFETSQAKTVLPTLQIDTMRYPEDLKEGMLQIIRIRMNPTNAVTYRARFWAAAINGAVTPYLQESVLIYEMDFDGADDIAYTIVLNRPFRLNEAGVIWYSIEWTGAPGNTMGLIHLKGEVFR
jgi:hypothetical protein